MSDGTCRICKCTTARACVTADGPCYWVEPDLCSAPGCAGVEYPAGRINWSAETNEVLRSDTVMQLKRAHLFMLISAIQLAQRHPRFKDHVELAEFIEQWKAFAIDDLVHTGQLKFMVESGDDPSMDIQTQETEERRIIVP